MVRFVEVVDGVLVVADVDSSVSSGSMMASLWSHGGSHTANLGTEQDVIWSPVE